MGRRLSKKRKLLALAIGSTMVATAAAMVSPLAGLAVLVGALATTMAWAIVTMTTCDPVTLLTVYLVVLFGIPSVYIFKPLGAVGTPAALVALIAFGWWGISGLILSEPSANGFSPVRLAVLGFVGAMLLTWGLGYSHPLEAAQSRSADRSLIGIVALAGVALLATDGVATRKRLDTLLLRLVDGGAFLASIGILQFFTGLNPSKYLRFPGLQLNGDLNSISARSDFRRVAGTAIHGIEFGVVLTLILPIALHYAFEGRQQGRLRRWFPVAVMLVAIPMSVSRSALVGLAAIALMLLPTWTWRRRANVAVVALGGGGAMRAAVPGLLGTLKSLVVGAPNDPSVTHRAGDIVVVFSRFVHSPWVGQGYGTYLPQEVRFLDNQYFGTIIETGLVGLILLACLLVVPLSAARGGRLRSADAETRSLGQALAASMLVAVFTFSTFDALGFPINAGVVFLLLGCAGAFWRLANSAQATVERFPASVSARNTGDLVPVTAPG